ncbi:hypothetical protein IAQ61_007577 [Plenodomus lingam]|uniref:uncharacterized protein n=1 Tax=Leptosphaeria maculans TaxID=5022 RepID=UPI00332E28FE|nr:hypothetical protein IAQ61_007577 [Plenodomus lingam]
MHLHGCKREALDTRTLVPAAPLQCIRMPWASSGMKMAEGRVVPVTILSAQLAQRNWLSCARISIATRLCLQSALPESELLILRPGFLDKSIGGIENLWCPQQRTVSSDHYNKICSVQSATQQQVHCGTSRTATVHVSRRHLTDSNTTRLTHHHPFANHIFTL